MTDAEYVDETTGVVDEDPTVDPAAAAAIARDLFLDWVTSHFATVEVFTDEKAVGWCDQWWLHPEAVERLKGLWLAYDEALLDPAGLSNWWLHQWDPTRTYLFSAKGPFRYCDREHGHLWQKREEEQAPPTPQLPPEDWWLRV